MTEQWEVAYRRTRAYIEPAEYLPCPGSTSCCKAVVSTRNSEIDLPVQEISEPEDLRCYRYL